VGFIFFDGGFGIVGFCQLRACRPGGPSRDNSGLALINPEGKISLLND